MGAVYILEGLAIYIYGFDHNPPHIHVRSGDVEFEINIGDRTVTGRATRKALRDINKFIDEHADELLAIWDDAQKCNKVRKIQR